MGRVADNITLAIFVVKFIREMLGATIIIMLWFMPSIGNNGLKLNPHQLF
jgi:hypothetical protein